VRVSSQKQLEKGSFELHCLECKSPVVFSIFELDSPQHVVSCPQCSKKYGFAEEGLKKHLKQFASLCLQIQESKDILGNAGVSVSVGKDEVTIPFKILLTRLKSTLDLQMGKEKFSISFRIEPTKL
jgi:DNA-directed RNA polymerase subunit RPC12/RpoP